MKIILRSFKIDYTTYILIFLALIAGYIKNVFVLLLIVLIHEFGHVFFFLLFGIEIEKIIIYPFGGVTYINKRIHERIYKDVLISLGGIIFQLILFLFYYLLFSFNLIVYSTYKMFFLYNLNIIVFNLLPLIPLDGSKLLLALFSKFFSYRRSYMLMIVCSVISLFLFILFNIFCKVNDLIIYIFLIIKLFEVVKNFNYVMNKFFLERILYNHYYNQIINDCCCINKMRIDKYYFFKDNNRYVNEKEFIKRIYYN